MAIPGTFSTYDLSTGVKLEVEDAIWTISPFDVPLQGAQGADGRTALATETVFEKKVEWLDEVLLTPRSTLGAQSTQTTNTVITVASGQQLNFQTGDVLLIDGEYMAVTGYGTTANTLLVTRGFGGSTPVQTMNTGDVVIGVGSSLPEGSTPPSARAVDRNDRFNYTQIFGPIGVSVSGTEQAVQKYGLRSTEFDHQAMNRTKENFIAVEQAILYGYQYVGTNTVGRTMNGMNQYITTNVDNTNSALSDSLLLPDLQACFDAGGTPDRLVMGSYQKRQLSAINSTEIRYVQDGNVRGQAIDYYDSDYGRLAAVLDRWVKKTDVFIFSRDQACICTLRPMTFEMLAKTGDFVQGQVVAEKTLKFRRQQWAAYLNNLA